MSTHHLTKSAVASATLDAQVSQSSGYCPFIPVFGAPQVMFVKGSGTELCDSDGKRYLDFLSGIAVTSLGTHIQPSRMPSLNRQRPSCT